MEEYELYKYEKIFQTDSDIDTDTKRKGMFDLVKFMVKMTSRYFGNPKFDIFFIQICQLSTCQD